MNVVYLERYSFVNCRVLIKRDGDETECLIGEKENGFRQGRGSMHKCLLTMSCVKISSKWERRILGIYGLERCMIRLIDTVCVDAKSFLELKE